MSDFIDELNENSTEQSENVEEDITEICEMSEEGKPEISEPEISVDSVRNTTKATDNTEGNSIEQVEIKPVKEKKKKKEKAPKEAKDKKRPFGVRILSAAAIGLIFGIFMAGGFYGVNQLIGDYAVSGGVNVKDLQKTVDDLQATVISNASNKETTIVNTVAGESDVTAVVEKVMPSMVSVTNIYEEVSYYFGRKYTQQNEASGSGIIVGENDKEYLIATNQHVIDSCISLTVKFVDGTEASAYVKGADSSIDIAVIAVSKDSLETSTKVAISVAELGDSDSLKMGETAIAIGNALGYGQSVTTGVISALNREIDLENSVSDLIQTSAAINPGNSGGALLNTSGQVIGINSSKIGSTTVEGMGFAIPINEVKDIIVDFSSRETKDKVAEENKGYLGIAGRSAAEIGLTDIGYPEGVYIAEVYAGSAAEVAGIYSGDIITKIDSQSVSTIEALQEYLSYFAAGESVEVEVVRRVEGRLTKISLDVVLGDYSSIEEGRTTTGED